MTDVCFRDGRNPALDVTFSAADYLLTLRALDGLAWSGPADAVVDAAAILRTAFVDELASLTRGAVVREALSDADAQLIAGGLAELADDSPEDFWMLMTWRLPILSAAARPSPLVIVTHALRAIGPDCARARELLGELESAVDSAALDAAVARLEQRRVPSPTEVALAEVADTLGHGLGTARLYWNPDTGTAFWSARSGDPARGGAREIERRLAAVPGIEHVTVSADTAPSADAEDGTDLSWVRVTSSTRRVDGI
jgi:hypothetical protein